MTEEAINIAIAEVCGWKFEARGKYEWIAVNPDGFEVAWSDTTPFKWTAIPSYCNDLNAMHEAESILTTSELQNRYQAEIAEITWGCEETGQRQVVFNQLTATARQRAEAFLRTLSLWQYESTHEK